MRVYALVETGDREAIDVFIRREDAYKALEDAIRDVPEWDASLTVLAIELDNGVSTN